MAHSSADTAEEIEQYGTVIMKTNRHGISVGIERIDSHFFVTFRVVGKLTHTDYEKIIPMVDSALEGVTGPTIDVFLDLSELDGWELRAAWDDFKISLKHGRQFHKIAIFGHRKWPEYGSRIIGWFLSGEVKYFEDAGAALSWLHSQ